MPLPSIPSKVTNTAGQDTARDRRTSCTRGLVVRHSVPGLSLAHGDDRCGSLAALEFAALLAVGVTVLGKSVAHRVQEKAYAEVSGGAPARTTPPPTGAPRLPRSKTAVLVLNGGGISGAAGATAETLRTRGYLIASVGNASHTDSSTRTLVMYRDGYRAEGVRLAHDARARLVSPLDGMPPRALLGAQVVIVVGR